MQANSENYLKNKLKEKKTKLLKLQLTKEKTRK